MSDFISLVYRQGTNLLHLYKKLFFKINDQAATETTALLRVSQISSRERPNTETTGTNTNMLDKNRSQHHQIEERKSSGETEKVNNYLNKIS